MNTSKTNTTGRTQKTAIFIAGPKDGLRITMDLGGVAAPRQWVFIASDTNTEAAYGLESETPTTATYRHNRKEGPPCLRKKTGKKLPVT